MDKKKQLLLKVLKKLQPYRNLAEGLIALVDSKYIDEKTIDGLLLIINQSIKNVKEGKEKTKLQKAVEVVQKIKHSEKIEREDEALEVERLLEDM
ncbi:hypothetical protein KKG31_00655 [Patescibacteria group bacterium]|nr:hypothetical protein [Patescibacteria group bacterium]MBU1757695.1 hypothetical protein [Patescibacteria group bacterium]